MQVDKIVQHLFALLSAFDLRGTLDFWEHLSQKFFSRIDPQFSPSVRKLEVGAWSKSNTHKL
jgi:hypothetical protein